MRYKTFRIRMPSGGVLRVRKPGVHGILSFGAAYLPLIATALECAPEPNEADKPAEVHDPIKGIDGIGQASLLEVDVYQFLPWFDRLALFSWAVGGAETQSVADDDAEVARNDLQPLLRGNGAILIDRACEKYGIRPSVVLGMQDADFAAELDLAIAIRGSQFQANAMSGDAEVEVEDYWGNKIKVPRKIIPGATSDPNATVMHADWLAKQYGSVVIGAGGTGAVGVIGSGH